MVNQLRIYGHIWPMAIFDHFYHITVLGRFLFEGGDKKAMANTPMAGLCQVFACGRARCCG
jgi:hypothetical protein